MNNSMPDFYLIPVKWGDLCAGDTVLFDLKRRGIQEHRVVSDCRENDEYKTYMLRNLFTEELSAFGENKTAVYYKVESRDPNRKLVTEKQISLYSAGDEE